MHEHLEYMGRAQKAEPSNIQLAQAVERLARGKPTRIILEPGDATRYELLIQPTRGMELRDPWLANYGLRELSQAWLVTYFRDPPPYRTVMVQLAKEVDEWKVEQLSPNQWSQRLLRWWLEGVRLMVAELQPGRDTLTLDMFAGGEK